MSGRGSAPPAIRQPGPPTVPRRLVVPVGSVPINAKLPAGIRLLDGLHALLPDGADSACVTLSGGCLAPFAYVIPALSPDAAHAAFYSATRRPAGETRLEAAAVTIGFREDAPFFHCHALWTEADGRRGCGHVLPEETLIAAPIEVRGVGIFGARFEARPDPETGFALFVPVPTGTKPPRDTGAAFAIRLAPNQDLVGALEQVVAAAGWRRARLAGGVGSTIGARFTDAAPIEGFATELLVRSGDIGGTDAAPTDLRVAIVDLDGAIGEGTLGVGNNPVLMTFEAVLQAC